VKKASSSVSRLTGESLPQEAQVSEDQVVEIRRPGASGQPPPSASGAGPRPQHGQASHLFMLSPP
jgi:hypothetical protein